MYDFAYSRLVDVKQISQHLLECACRVETQSDKQLVDWADTVIPLSLILQIIFYL